MAQPVRNRRRRVLTIVGVVGVFLVLALGTLVAFAPAIASSMAPGIVRDAAGQSIAGEVSVAGASLSWGGPQKIGPITLSEPGGKPVVTVTAESTVGLWALIRGGRDLGTITLSGSADLVRSADGSTNLERATAPVAPAAKPAPSAQPATLPQGLAAKLNITGVDIGYREVDDRGNVARAAVLKSLRGEASVTTAAGSTAKLDLGAVVGDNAGPAGSIKITMTIDNFADAQGRLTPASAKIDTAIDASSVPVPLVDAMANLGGMLSDALGPVVTATIRAKGDAAAGTADIKIASQNLNADAALALADGKLVAQRQSSVSVRGTGFLAKFPRVRDALAGVGVTINQWPMLDAKVNALTLPLPRAGAGARDGPDLRGVALDLELKTGALAGRLQRAAPTGGEAPAPQPFGLSPTTLSVKSADLAQGVTLAAATHATLDNQSAGSLRLEAQAGELLDGEGRLALPGGYPGVLSGSLTATGVSTSLAAPFLAADSPLDLAQDIGPTVDVTGRFERIGGPGALGLPAMDVDLGVSSRNLTATAPLRLAAGAVSARSEVTAEVARSADLLRRVLERGAPAGRPGAQVGGEGRLRLTVRELSAPLGEAGGSSPVVDPARATLDISATLQSLDARLPDSRAGAVAIKTITATARQRPGEPARAGATGTLSHNGSDFVLSADVGVRGLAEALASGAPGAFIPGVGPLRMEGAATVTDLPMSLAGLMPGAPAAGAAPQPGADTAAIVRELTSGLVGDRATIAVTLSAGANVTDPQRIAATITGAGLRAAAAADLAPGSARLASLDAEATVRPETLRAVLTAAGQAQGDLGRVGTRGPAKVRITATPVTIPLAPGGLSPDLARAGETQVAVMVGEPLIVTGIPAGAGKALTGGVRDFQAGVGVPLAILAPGGAPAGEPIRAQIRAKLLLDEGRAVGDFSVAAAAPRSLESVDATVTLAQLDTAAVDGVLGEPGLVSGALGPRADITLTATRRLKAPAQGEAAGPMRAKVQIANAARLRTDPLDVSMDETRIALVAPALVAWTIDPAWADKYLLKPADGPAPYRLAEPLPASVDIRRLVISTPESRGGLVVTGPLKPGVFALDLSVAAPIARLIPNGATEAVGVESLTMAIRTDERGALSISAQAVPVNGANGPTREPLTLAATVRDVATAGGSFNKEGYSADIDLRAPSVPTAMVDAVAGMNGRLVDLLGPQTTAMLNTTNFSPRENTRGAFAVDIRAFRPPASQPSALVLLTAPVNAGLIETGSGTVPLRVELAEFNLGEREPLVQTLGIVASMSKTRLGPDGKPNPAVITSNNLKIPINPNRGNLRRLSGDIDVSLGTVNYTLRSGLSSLIQDGMIKDLSRGVQQPPMKPFKIIIRDGVVEYTGVEIPLKVGLGLGEEIVILPLNGKVNLVDQTIDGEVDVPLELVSSSVLSVLPVGFSDLRKGMLKVLGDKDADAKQKEGATKARTISVPIRITGPLSNPKFTPDLNLFGARTKDLNPVSIIEGFGEAGKRIEDTIKGIGDLFKKPK